MRINAKRRKKQAVNPIPHQDWQGNLTPTRCSWKKTKKPENFFMVLSLSILAPIFIFFCTRMMAILSTLVGSAVLIIFLTKELNTEDKILKYLLIVAMLSHLIILSFIFLLISFRKQVVAFSFDAETKTLHYATIQLLRKSRKIEVPFGLISEITPIICHISNKGYFQLKHETSTAKHICIDMGEEIPITQLELHAKWLAEQLGERVQPSRTLTYD